jgi:Galactose oxidase, central domain
MPPGISGDGRVNIHSVKRLVPNQLCGWPILRRAREISMKKNSGSHSGIFNPRALLAFILGSAGMLLAMMSLAAPASLEIKYPIQQRKNSSVVTLSSIQENWTQLSSYAPPAIREGSAGAFDSQRNETVIFGGFTPNGGSGLDGDTWTFDGQRWTQKNPLQSPTPRTQPSAVYDTARNQIVLFGGTVLDGSGMNDTWTWDGTTWTQQHPVHSPSVRYAAAMAYDPATQRVVLFGGEVVTGGQAATPLGDTWTWDGNDWTQQIPAASPSPRYEPGFANGGQGIAPLLFGGSAEGNVQLGDAWTWDGSIPTWLPVAAIGPAARAGLKLVFDPSRGVDVMFGGFNAASENQCAGSLIDTEQWYGDTWIWNGTQWSQVNPAISPVARGRFVMSFDSAQSRVRLFAGVFQGCATSGSVSGWANDTWAFDGSNWVQEDLSTPDELQSAMLAREPRTGSAILFSGQFETGMNSTDTWLWTGSQWQLLHPAHSPLPRQWGTLTFDPISNTTILFGGLVDTYGYPGTRQQGDANDTWTWDGTDWTQLNPVTSPPTRQYATAAFDAARGQIVVFGGLGDSGILNDTWTWDGTNWTQQHPVNSPPARFTASMAYDPVTQKVVLFGGTIFNTQYFDDTWTWDGTNWTQEQPSTVPPARAYTSLAYDPMSSSLILFGGCTTCFGTATDSDTWSWDGQNWNQLQPATSPPGRGAQAMVDGDSSSPILVFGGRQQGNAAFDSGTPYLNDLWAFGATPTILTSVVSRKTHGNGGTFDVDLTGGNGIECRSGGANGSYTLVFAFPNTLTSVDSASVTRGIVAVATGSIDSNDEHDYVVNLTGVINAQVITVSLTNVADSVGNFSSTVSASMGVLLGDVDGSGRVDGNDVSAVQSHTRQATNSTNFRFDVDTSGRIDGNDVSTTQQQTRASLP